MDSTGTAARAVEQDLQDLRCEVRQSALLLGMAAGTTVGAVVLARVVALLA